MTELSLPLILNIILFIALPFVCGLIATKLRVPRMLGYIIAGMLLGSFLSGGSDYVLSIFANVGLIFLLFAIGLEIDIRNIRRFGKHLFYIGLGQIALSALFFWAVHMFFGFPLSESFVLGFAFALSSTAIVSKVIQEKGEENSLVGGMTLGILLIQDLAVIPFMILLNSLVSDAQISEVIFDVLFSFAKAGGILVLIYYTAHQFVPYLFGKVAQLSRELLNLLTILFIFVAVYVFSILGLSPAIAAFVAGVLIGGTLEHYQIFSQIRPLRDIFTILFFVFLGASIHFSEIVSMLPLAVLFAVFVVAMKFFIVVILFTYFRFHSKTAFSAGIFLSQIGEFAFIVLHQAEIGGAISDKAYMFAITTTLLTIVISPILMDRREFVYSFLRKYVKKHSKTVYNYIQYKIDREPAHIDGIKIKNHVIICGYGRVGGYIGRALMLAGVEFIAIDYNYRTVELEKKKGVNIIYGDPTDIDILDFAQAEYAAAIISAVPDVFSQEMIILNSKMLNQDITIFTRVALEKNQQRMKDLGAQIVVQPEFEAALSIIKRVLKGYKMEEKDIKGKIQRLKIEHGMA